MKNKIKDAFMLGALVIGLSVVSAEKMTAIVNERKLESDTYNLINESRENLSNTLSESFKIQNFQPASFSVYTNENKDVLRIFGACEKDAGAEYQNLYMQLDKADTRNLIDIVQNFYDTNLHFNDGGHIGYDYGLSTSSGFARKTDLNFTAEELDKMNESIGNVYDVLNDICKYPVNKAVEPIGDVEAFKTIVEKNNGFYGGDNLSIFGEENATFVVGNDLIKDIHKEGDELEIDLIESVTHKQNLASNEKTNFIEYSLAIQNIQNEDSAKLWEKINTNEIKVLGVNHVNDKNEYVDIDLLQVQDICE